MSCRFFLNITEILKNIVMSECFSSPFFPPNVAPFESLFPRNASSQRWTDDAKKRRTDGRDLQQEKGEFIIPS